MIKYHNKDVNKSYKQVGYLKTQP